LPKYKPEIAENIRQAILDCNIRRLTLAETRQYVVERLCIEMNIQVISRYRAQLRQSAQRWIARLAKSKRADYIAEYRERIDEVRKCQRELWNIVYDAKTFQRVKIEAIAKVLECTKQLVALYDCLPLINAIRDYGCGYDHNNKDLLQQDHHPADESSIDSLA
jgi:hypothetical protein